MKLKAITFEDDGTTAESLTFTMTLNEANAILGVFGQLNGIAARKMGLRDDESVYDGLSDAFRRLYESGYKSTVPAVAGLNNE